jgi:uncharacterized protein YggE
VTGDAEVRAVPNEVILTLGIETWDEDLAVAKDQNDERTKRVLGLAREYGLESRHVRTEHISIEPRYHDGYEKRDFLGFFVRKTIVLTLRDLTQFEGLLTDALGNGVTHVHGVQFRTTELRAHKDTARALAVQAAREKALALAGELGQGIGEPQSISEDRSGWWSGYGAWWGPRWGSAMTQNVIQNAEAGPWVADSSLAPGQIAVNARVTVSFELR